VGVRVPSIDVINQNIGLIAGVAVAIILIFVLMIVGFLVYRKQVTQKQKKLLEEYSSQLQMVRGAACAQIISADGVGSHLPVMMVAWAVGVGSSRSTAPASCPTRSWAAAR
jgi:uncharacterized membrane protein YqiK